ncbi:MAG: Cof-type HAD-IIB family hydrolase [Lachnospiraceae bacterium]|nr:Cof-type HAD-IIB family hydrolase [Lachnospiraceae bacterium]
MMASVRMIGIDLDGTLLSTEKKISPYNREMIKRVAAQGIEIVIATGRPFRGLREVAAGLPIRYILSSNGARVVDMKDNDRVLVENLLNKEVAKKVLMCFEPYDVVMEAFYNGQGYISEKDYNRIHLFHNNPSMWEYVHRTRKSVADLLELVGGKEQDLDKVQAIFNDLDKRKDCWAALEAMGDVTLVGSLSYNIEVNGKGVDKGSGLLELAELLGIKDSEIMAFGDNNNDLKMLERVGFGIAMANGSDDVKEVADYITLSNDQDGVGKALEKFIL